MRIIILLLFQQRMRSRFEAPMPDASQDQHQRGGWWDQEQQNSYKMQPADIEESIQEHGFMVSCLVTSRDCITSTLLHAHLMILASHLL